MVRNYKRKTHRGEWNQDDMRRAVNAVITEKIGFLRASIAHNVPKSTLERHVRKARNCEQEDSDNNYGRKSLGRYKAVFNKDQENELAAYVKAMQARLFGITGKELRVLAFQLAERNNIENPFNAENGMAGEDWLNGFMKRHPDLTYRRPEPTSAARTMAFNKVVVNEFFTLLEQVVDQYSLTPDRIYNVDETGVSTVPKSQSKILSLKGMKQVGCLSSAERGQLVTAEICFNAAGTYVPPMLIYPRKRMKDELLDDAPPGFWGTCSDNGWITLKIFFDWFKSFVKFTGASKEKTVLLILDGHASHTKNIEVIDYAREHHVIMLCTPPHCTHKLQPADVTFNGPLSTYYSAEVKKWLREHPGRVVTPYQVAKLFGKAYLKAATMLTAINGFKACGIWPIDKNIFTEADFIAAETTNTERIVSSDDMIATTTNDTSNHTEITSQPRASTSAILVSSIVSNTYNSDGPVASTSQKGSQLSASTSPIASSINSDCGVIPKASGTKHLSNPIISPDTAIVDQQRSPLSSFIEEREKTPEKQMANSSFLVSPSDIVAVPKQIRTQKRKKRKRGKTAVLTNSPYKNELKRELETKIKKTETDKLKTEKKKSGHKSNEKKTKQNKPEEKVNGKKPKKNKTKRTRKETDTDTDSSEEDDDDCSCIYCGYLYSQSVEGWVMCSVCHGWAHNSCAGVDEEDDDAHTCELCQPD